MKRHLIVPVAIALAVPLQSADRVSAQVVGDPAAGEAQFARCTSCHSVTASTRNKPGPNLQGIVGKKAGTADVRYAYSAALKASGLTWSTSQIERFLAAPSRAVPGNKMTFAGIDSAQTRANIAAYLAESSGK